MARHNGIIAKSAAHDALVRLVELGGRATLKQLKQTYTVGANFHQIVVAKLTAYDYADFNGDSFKVTEKGKKYVAEFWEQKDGKVEQTTEGKVALPRMPTPFKPLSTAPPAAPYRPGAFEYREIPSLMGDTRKLPSGEIIK